jgi:hypothetical protein
MYKRKLYKCSVCGVEVPDLPMPVLKHQMSHVWRRPCATSARDRESNESAADGEPVKSN